MIEPNRGLGVTALALAAWLGLAWVAEAAPRTLSFGGYTWKVRPDQDGSPGPNHWRSANAWLDDNGALHLKLTRKKGVWYCVELQTVEHLGFGTYQFWLDSRVDNLDPNVVLAFFNYPAKQGLDGTNEIDIEYGKWGVPEAPALDYVVYPSKAGSPPSGWSFQVTDPSAENTQRFTWTPQSVRLQALAGHQNGDSGQYAAWTFAPDKPRALVPQFAMPLHINLWLNAGLAPQDHKEIEVVIRDFSFTPLP